MKDQTLEDYLEQNNLVICKRLSDEEIEEVAKVFRAMDYKEFARAILRKANEK